MNTFYKWLIKQSYRDDPVGDLATDMKRDTQLPERKTKRALMNHLLFQGVDDLVIEAFHQAWSEYKEFRKYL